MFGGPARMFPHAPLWLSTGLVRPIKYSEEWELEKMATVKWLINDVLNWTWNKSNMQHSCNMPFTVFLFLLLLLLFLPMLSFSFAVFTGCRYYLLPILPLPFFPWIVESNENFKVIQNPGFLRITPKIKSLVVCAILDRPSKFQKDLSILFELSC